MASVRLGILEPPNIFIMYGIMIEELVIREIRKQAEAIQILG